MITALASRTARALTALVCALAAALPANAAASSPQEPPDTGAGRRTASAWLPYWDQENGYQDALRHAGQLHTVSPFWYKAAAADRIEGHPGAGDTRIINGLHKAGIQVIPTVMDMDTMKRGELARILTTPALRTAHTAALVRLARGHGYDGIDLDYETITTTPTAGYRTVRSAYAAFVTGLCAKLHAVRKQCVVTVSPQTATTGRIWDYAAIGRAADRMRIMAYDLHWSGGPPGPLSSTAWYDEILRRATALVPAARIETALPGYGWDWPADGSRPARHLTWKQADALRREVGAPYALDPESGTPHFTYRDGAEPRTVWYQDARGAAVQLAAVRGYGVRNTSLWALGFEDPGLWKVLARQ
ncbi:glycosyl hydrolase [Streptomyces sp. SID10853]|uniref:glycosyl hydrolase family 18 protein n=1 Tax=Streptomyces sp. SID10853 TaxID=2706028 RepID=UPI0013BF6842|nr:glycosyl hydrolase family 18 protein [Streptomyces sp. SID10853]NDZ78264.1 glycosyl hydrolase [Streptomyces sp. SID10853]